MRIVQAPDLASKGLCGMGSEDIPLGVRKALRGRIWRFSHAGNEAEPPVGHAGEKSTGEVNPSASIPRRGADLKIVLPGDESPRTAGAVADLASAGVGKLEFQIDQLMPVRADHARQVRRELRDDSRDLFPHFPAPIYNLRIRSRTADLVPSSSWIAEKISVNVFSSIARVFVFALSRSTLTPRAMLEPARLHRRDLREA